jgi:Glycosyltransferase family 87
LKTAQDSLNGTIPLTSHRWLLSTSVLTLVFFAIRVYETWTARGLFDFIGVDYAIYGATAHVVTDIGWTHLYDTESITQKIVQFFLPYYGPMADSLKSGPSPYPALFVLPFIVTNLLGPLGGFAAWTAFNVLTVLAITRGMLRGSEHLSRTIYLVPFVFLPLSYNLFLGQLAIIMTLGLYKSYSSFQEGHEFRAGLWLGLLLLKPQFALVLATVLLGKGRWRALGGLSLSGIALASSTIALVGVDGVRSYLDILRSFSGFRRVPAIVNPQYMINFRGILVTLLPEGYGENQGTIVVLALSAALTISLIVVWRGRWDPFADCFPWQMLATLIVAMLTGFHNHIHGATLLIVPMLAAITRNRRPGPLQDLLLLVIFLPMYVILFSGSLMYSSWSLTGVMACFYGVILVELCRNRGLRSDRQSSDYIATSIGLG